MSNALTRRSAPMGIKPIGEQQFQEDFAIYVFNTGSLAAAASVTGSIQIQADSSFEWIKGAYFADIAGAAQTGQTLVVPLCTITIQDGGSGRQLFSSAVPIPSVFGTGDLPFILPVPRVFMPNSTINLTVANFSAATTYANVRVSFIGRKWFRL